MTVTRRNVIRRGLLASGGIVGIGLAGRAAGGTASLAPVGWDFSGTASGAAAASTTTTLYGRDWHIESSELRRGQLPRLGQRMLASGTLLDAPDGARVGDFVASYVSLNAADRFGAMASVEHHVLQFDDGTLVGMGTTGEGVGSEDAFAIIGGTGRYLGARGSYVLRQSHAELGGDGTATLKLTLIGEV